jgi:di/tripeptidase
MRFAIIRKPATAGMETAPIVMQGHLDMVSKNGDTTLILTRIDMYVDGLGTRSRYDAWCG